MKLSPITLVVLLVLSSCNQIQNIPETPQFVIDTLQGGSLLQKPLISPQVNQQRDSLQIQNYLEALKAYEANKDQVPNIVWLGRRIAYLGDYKKAIEIYSKGINKFPNEAQFYRHRGHRYISTRQLDKAITDFEVAVDLIKNKTDKVEPDGIPNRLNQPVSSLHTNIWYHLGLAYYLKGEFNNALAAFHECFLASKNDDMIVATSHWLYMILRRMELPEEATMVLNSIHKDMNIIENTAYHKLLLFYKGELSEKEFSGNASLGSSEAVQYGLGNWYFYNGNKTKAISIFKTLIESGNWAGFGYIAAEADLSRE